MFLMSEVRLYQSSGRGGVCLIKCSERIMHHVDQPGHQIIILRTRTSAWRKCGQRSHESWATAHTHYLLTVSSFTIVIFVY